MCGYHERVTTRDQEHGDAEALGYSNLALPSEVVSAELHERPLRDVKQLLPVRLVEGPAVH